MYDKLNELRLRIARLERQADLRPFGGMKKSGIGREGGHSSLHFFTEPKNICIKFI